MKLKWPCGFTLGLSLAILICLVAAGELLLRWDFLQARLSSPSIGSNSRNLDVKLHLLNKMVEREGSPDCLFLGNSMVNTDIDPEEFKEAYRTFTRHTIRCFNFGINGMTPYPAAKFIRVLNHLYRPKMVIWGITPSDLNTSKTNKEVELENGSWVNFHLGHGDFNGWLTAKSYLYRYYLRFHSWMYFPKINRINQIMEAQTTAYGFLQGRSGSIVTNPILAEWETRYRRIMSQYKIDRRVLPMLYESFRSTPGTTLILAEMPVHHACLSYYNGGGETHYKIIAKIKKFAGQKGIHFIPLDPGKPFSDKNWQNYNHLNDSGARQFSRWLGNYIGAAVSQGLIPDPCRSGN